MNNPLVMTDPSGMQAGTQSDLNPCPSNGNCEIVGTQRKDSKGAITVDYNKANSTLGVVDIAADDQPIETVPATLGTINNSETAPMAGFVGPLPTTGVGVGTGVSTGARFAT